MLFTGYQDDGILPRKRLLHYPDRGGNGPYPVFHAFPYPTVCRYRRNLVGQNDLSMVTAKLDLKVDQLNAEAVEILSHHIIYLKGILCDRVDLLLSCQVQCQCVVAVDERISQIIIL